MGKGPFTPFGKTGQFPRGKLHESDEGELKMGVIAHGGSVIVNFGTAVKWIGMPPAQARELAKGLVEAATKAERSQ